MMPLNRPSPKTPP